MRVGVGDGEGAGEVAREVNSPSLRREGETRD